MERSLRSYRETLPRDRRAAYDLYRYRDVARKVVGVGSVGTRAWVVLLFGRDSADPLFLQTKQAQASVLERFVGRSRFRCAGRRVVEGQRLMQAVGDILLGWFGVPGFDGRPYDFYVRQLWDGKGSFNVTAMTEGAWHTYAQMCALGARARPRALGRPDRHRRVPRSGRRVRPRRGRLRRRVRRPEPARLRRSARGRGLGEGRRADGHLRPAARSCAQAGRAFATGTRGVTEKRVRGTPGRPAGQRRSTGEGERSMEAERYELASLVDLDRVRRLCDSLSQAFDIALAVIDLSGDVLVATGWQDICTRFHRENTDTLSGCLESDLRINRRLAEGLDPSEHYAYQCGNGLWDVAFPLVVASEHVANVYTGQFFFDDDRVDRAEFARRARRLGFDEEAYLVALDRVPVISHEHLQKTVRFLADFVGMLGEMGFAALQEKRKHAQLVESEERYHRLFDNASEGLTVFRVERGPGGEIEDVVVVDLNPIQAERTRVTRAQLIGRRLSECDGRDERLRAYFDLVRGSAEAQRAKRRDVCLHAREAYELLSAYPAGEEDLWVLSATDVTDLREAEQALHRQDEGIRKAYVDVLDAVTGGKLILLTEEQLLEELGRPLGQPFVFGAPAQLAMARSTIVCAAETRFPGRIRHNDLLSTSGEALDNAIKHAGGGSFQVYARGDCLQVAITDEGPGIDFRTLPRATLVPGFSTAASLGMGFTIMLQLCERVLLSTRPGRTVVVLELAASRDSALAPARAGG